MSNDTLLFLVFISFCSFTVLFFLIGALLNRRANRYRIRLEKYLPMSSAGAGNERLAKTGEKKRFSPVDRIGKIFDGLTFLTKWEKPLIQAGVSIAPSEFFVYRLLFAIGSSLIVTLYDVHFMYCIGAGIIGYLLPSMYLKIKFKKRMYRCSLQLSEALGTMSNAMRAGFSFMQAMKLISEEYPDPLGMEFKRALRDIQYGLSMEDAFARMLERLPHPDLEMVIQSLNVQRVSGGNLALLLETAQETIRGRFRVQEELNTLTAQGKLSSWVITFLPIALAMYLKLANPDYFNILLTHPLGIGMLGMAGMNILIGWILIRKIVKIEV